MADRAVIQHYSRAAFEAARELLLPWLVLGAVAVFYSIIATHAHAGPPIHQPLPDENIEGLNHACGTAVDSNGYVYASSAGASKILVFAPADHETPVTEISNPNEPCGLAVDSAGNLYVSERGTGNVVKYTPDAYPLTASPSYGPAIAVGDPGEATGISIDPTNDSLYVAKGDRVEYYRSEVQEVRIRNATGGTYKLSFKGEETAPLPYNATDAQVQSALEALVSIGAGEVSVSPGEGSGTSHKISFQRGLGFADLPQVKLLSSLAGNTIQKVTVAASAGTYKLSFEGEETAAIAFNASAAELKAALEALPNLASGDVSVAGGPGDAGGTNPYVLSFEGAYAAKNVGFLSIDTTALSGSVSVSRTQGLEIFATTTLPGGRGLDETQQIRVTSALSGTYTLSFEGEETTPLAPDAPASKAEGAGSVEAALEGLAAIAPSDVTVLFMGSPTFSSRIYEVGFSGSLAARDLPNIKTVSALSPNETQKVTVKATAGTYTLTPTIASGTGSTTSGSKTVTDVETEYGAFQIGDKIEGEGIPAGTTVSALGAGTIELSAPATDTTSERPLRALETTAAIAFNATAAALQAALETLGGIGPGDVSVAGGPGDAGGTNPYLVAFGGAFAGHDLREMSVNPAALTGTAAVSTQKQGAGVSASTPSQGFGNIGEGEFSNASGVAVYTFPGKDPFYQRRYISIADAASDEIEVLVSRLNHQVPGTPLLPGTLEPRATIDGSSTPEGELGLAATGTYLGLDPKNGHVFAYDDVHKVVNEFEATGRYFTRIEDGEFVDGEPTAIAVDRSGGSDDGAVYVSVGASSGAKLLAFKGVAKADRRDLPALSHQFTNACGTVVDSQGDLFVAGATTISIYDTSGGEIGSIDAPEHPCALAIDTEGNLYAVERGSLATAGDEKIRLYKPSNYPFTGTPAYGAPTLIEKNLFPNGVAVHPIDDRLFVSHEDGHGVIVYKSAKDGSGLLKSGFCPAAGSSTFGIDVYGANDTVYVASELGHAIDVCNSSGTKVLAHIDGSGSPEGPFGGLSETQIAVDQSNGYVVVGEMITREAIEEYEASGAFVASFGQFTSPQVNVVDIALDNSGGTNGGNLYAAFDGAGSFDVTAFGPLSYGGPPVAVTGTATPVGVTGATLNGTVVPGDLTEVEECAFEWGKAGQPYEHKDPCAETSEQIGLGDDPVPVHLDLSGIEPDTAHYHFRLTAKNEFGEDPGEEGLFGPPLLTEKGAQPILYKEATLHGEIDPFGLETDYHFEYLSEEAFLANGGTFAGAQVTPTQTLPASTGGPSQVEAFLTGLSEGTTYHLRLVAENEAAVVKGAGQELTTLEREHTFCPNETLRLENNSSHLPDCRAYELVTPADVRNTPHAEEFDIFNDWLVTPAGPAAGESLAFFLHDTTLPGTEGNGLREAFRTTRSEKGWTSASFGPSNAQKGAETGIPTHLGMAPDQMYSFWTLGESEPPPGTFPPGNYLRGPGGFEAIGEGSLGEDLAASPDYVSAGGTHVIFSSTKHLENAAAPATTRTIYDREAGSSQANVVSLRPDGTPFGSGEPATYLGATPDGSAVAFSVSGDLYLRRDSAPTIEIVGSPFSFAGLSADGQRVFYTNSASSAVAAGLSVCEVEAGACSVESIAVNGKFVNVSADGSHAYFTSETPIGGEGVPSAPNLFAWSGAGTKFIAMLDQSDFPAIGKVPFPGTAGEQQVGLDVWTERCVGMPEAGSGRAACPSRTTPDGRFVVFQSHADLVPPYEDQGHSQIYRYDSLTSSLLCVSCDPSGVPASADADLQAFRWPNLRSTVMATTLVPGVSEDGGKVFFQTAGALLPEDANTVLDVYEWRAAGVNGCTRSKGCFALISSGQGDKPSTIYSETLDGHDVFFSTEEKLIPSDIVGSPSVYNARVEGGFPQPGQKEPCHGDACQPPPNPAPERSLITTGVPSGGNEKRAANRRCPKGHRSVKRKGKTHCVKRRHKKHKHANQRQGATR